MRNQSENVFPLDQDSSSHLPEALTISKERSSKITDTLENQVELYREFVGTLSQPELTDAFSKLYLNNDENSLQSRESGTAEKTETQAPSEREERNKTSFKPKKITDFNPFNPSFHQNPYLVETSSHFQNFGSSSQTFNNVGDIHGDSPSSRQVTFRESEEKRSRQFHGSSRSGIVSDNLQSTYLVQPKIIQPRVCAEQVKPSNSFLHRETQQKRNGLWMHGLTSSTTKM